MCSTCDRARAFPAYTLYCPSCLWCGARLIQLLGAMQITQPESNRRRRETLAEWLEWGHSEVELRRLAKADALPLAPIGPVVSTESVPPTHKKRR